MKRGKQGTCRRELRQRARCWFLIFLESSVLFPLSVTLDNEWESGMMTKVHAEDACGEPAHWKEGKEIIHQEELFHSSSLRGWAGARDSGGGGLHISESCQILTLPPSVPLFGPFPCMLLSRDPTQIFCWDVPSTAPREMALAPGPATGMQAPAKRSVFHGIRELPELPQSGNFHLFLLRD